MFCKWHPSVPTGNFMWCMDTIPGGPVCGEMQRGPKNKGCRIPLRQCGQFAERTIGGEARDFECACTCARRFQRLHLSKQELHISSLLNH
jgi:hypothetical protein